MILKIANYFLERINTRPPRGVQHGSGVKVRRPYRISNPKCVIIGERTTIGSDALIEPITEYAGVRFSPTIVIEKDVYIGPFLYLACMGQITIGEGSVLSEHVYINDASHGMDPERGLIIQQELIHRGDITIGKNCFLGLRSAIMPGVTLGDRCIVGVNSVVTKSFPAFSMIAGSPAVLVKRYSHEQKTWVRVP